jgi:hypothetical protein
VSGRGLMKLHMIAAAVMVLGACVVDLGASRPAATERPAAPPRLTAPAAPVAPHAPAAPDPAEQARTLAVRAAHVDALGRMTDLVLAAKLPSGKTVGQAVGAGTDAEIALRLVLRSARPASEPRVYSDGVAQVDIEAAADAIVRCLRDLGALGPTDPATLPDLQSQTIDGYLRATGSGVAPRDLAPEAVKRVLAARPEDLPEMFPAGWERVTAAGRVEAVRMARVRAYGAMTELVRGIRLSQADKAEDAIAGSPVAQAAVDSFVRSLPVVGQPRMMPDRIAEVEVAASVRDLIRLLKEIRSLGGAGARWTDEEIDQLSVRMKADRVTVLGRGTPPAADVMPLERRGTPAGAPPPDWANEVLDAQASAPFNDEIDNPDEARVLAARLAKARALADIERRVDDIKLDDGRTVRQRAGKDDVFRRDLKTFLSSARTAVYRSTEDKKGWEVVLKLPLLRLYEFSRPRE